MKLTELKKKATFLKLLQAGSSGVGKTCIASTFPRPIYYADTDDEGVKSLIPFYDYDDKKLEGIDYDVYTDPNPKAPDAMNRLEQKLASFLAQPVFPYKTIVIDHLTGLEDRVMNRVIFNTRQTKRVLGAANMQDYGLVIWQLEEFIQTLMAMPCHVVLNCHTQVIQTELTKDIIVQPLVAGKKLPNKLPIWFDEVYVLVNQYGKRVWQLRPEGLISMAKTRILPKSTPTFIDASFEELAKHMHIA
jgi:hypothetical protein